MRKNVVKTLVAGSAACLMAGLVIFSGVNDSAKADGAVICDYSFDDGNLGDCYGNSCTVEITEGMNSGVDKPTVDESGEHTYSTTDGNCVKVSKRTGYWETAAFAYKVDALDPNTKYTITYDFYHDNGFADKYGTSNRVIITHVMDGYGQIGQPMAVFDGEWERVSWDFALKDVIDTSANTPKYIYLEFAYPEETNNDPNKAYHDSNTETYYIDNFSIKEYEEPTPTPIPTATATPTAAPTAVPQATDAPTVVTVAATPTPYVDLEPEGLENGYEETVKGIVYVVTGKDTVKVKEAEEAASNLVIPDTVVLDEENTYKVTEIGAKAFSGENIKKLTIGANVTKIGKQAFFKCKSLKNITIKSAAITKIEAKAFKNTHKKAVVKVPKAKKKNYKKLLQKAGLSKKAKIK